MATNPPPDRPTEPLPRGRPAPSVERTVPVERPASVYEERVVAPAVDPNIILLRLEDAIDALRTWLVVVAVLAIVALGVALYAVLGDDATSSSGSRSGLASDDRVSQIENRVDRLSRQVQDLRTDGSSGGDTSALASRIDQLENTVKSLPSQSTGGTQDAIDELSSRIDALSKDVEQLKQAQSTTP